MRILPNSHIPFRGFQAINLCGVIFVRKEHFPLSEASMRHEKIHTRQIQELAFVPFYLLYLAEWLFRSIQQRSFRQGYFAISFEREAYSNQEDPSYLQTRKRWAFVNYYNHIH